jgi:putative ABC transport system ATP-binding protein
VSISTLGREDPSISADPMVEGRALVKSFGRTPALNRASVSVASGEILAVMGPSGSGKSTLLHCLAGIFTPDAGEVLFDRRRIDSLGEKRRSELRRTDFGFVFQFGQLVPELTVEDNIALPLLLGGTGRRDAYAAARSWLPRLGLDDLGGRRTGEVSGGEAQRVALARALVHQPKVLFADEPTGTVVLVTHEARVAAYADRLVLVRDGRVTVAEPAAVGADPPVGVAARPNPPSVAR